MRPAGQTNVKSPVLTGNVTEITGRDDGRRPAHDFDPALEKRGGRSFGAAPSEVHPCKYTDLFDRPRDRPHYVVPPHQRLPGSGRWRQLFGACVIWP
jgi:hypothetical protein